MLLRFYRPEKDHQVQLHALKLLFDLSTKYKSGKDSIKLMMAGSVRNKGDEDRVDSLRKLAEELEVEVSFIVFSLQWYHFYSDI